MIMLKAPEEIEIMRAANLIVAEILAEIEGAVRPGITTAELDSLAEQLTRQKGAVPAFKGYEVGGRVFPASLCTSINDEVVHGIPSDKRVLFEGDIIGLDFGVCYRGFYGDAAMSIPVGIVSPEARGLMRAAREALEAGIEEVRPGRRLGDVGAAIQAHAEGCQYSVVREFVGHGIGRRLHNQVLLLSTIARMSKFSFAEADCDLLHRIFHEQGAGLSCQIDQVE